MTILSTIDPASAEPTAKTLLEAVRKGLGVVPNLMRVLAANPAVLKAYLDFSATLGAGHLGGKLHEQIALAVAEANGCQYCLAAHTLLGQKAGLQPAEILNARAGQSSDTRTTAALALARKLVADRGRVSAAEIAKARSASLTDADIVEIIGLVALNVFTNYVNIAADTDIDFPPAEKLSRVA